MSDRTGTILGRIVILTVIVAAIATLAFLILRAGVDETVSMMAAISGVLGGVAAILALWDRLTSQTATEESARPPPSHQALTGLSGGVGESEDEAKSKADRAQEIEDSLDWRSAGTRNYPNGTVRIARALARRSGYLPIPERWSRRAAFALAALSLLWLLLILGRLFDEFVPGLLSDTLLTIIYAVQAPTIFAQTPAEFISLIVPVLILAAVVLGGDLKERSTCEACGESWALENEGTHYHRDSKTRRSETIDGEEHTWNEYEGIQILRCVHENCRKYQFRETGWDDRPFWEKL